MSDPRLCHHVPLFKEDSEELIRWLPRRNVGPLDSIESEMHGSVKSLLFGGEYFIASHIQFSLVLFVV